MSDEEINKKILMLMGHRGFLWGPAPEIYNPVKGSFEYGPLGKLMKNNLEHYMRKEFRKRGFWEVQCPLIGSKIIWKASGHVDRFFDYITQCTNQKCNNVHRVDTMLEGLGYDLTDVKMEDFNKIIEKDNIKCPDCDGILGVVTEQNLMVTSQLGFPSTEFILRPETATTTYLTFPRLYEHFRTNIPIYVFQMGPAFRNEISPRKMLLRTREFEQCEGQIFIKPEQEMNFGPFEEYQENTLKLWSAEAQESNDKEVKIYTLKECVDKNILQKPAYTWLLSLAYEITKGLGIPEKSLRLRQHKSDERAHYAHDAWDLEVNSRIYGWTEVCGIHDRGDYDLGRHKEFSKKKSLLVPGEKKGEKIIPHVLEIAFGVGRLFFFALEQAFRFEEERNLLDLPMDLTPVPFAVFPLMNKPELRPIAKKIFEDLIDNDINAIYDASGSIGKRYRRTEEVGVRFAYTIDYQSVEDNTVTIRNIDDMTQKRIKIDELIEISSKLMRSKLKYEDIDSMPSKK
ncbi:MAG: glycine--tRNA ligase [archaeon]|nr:glycine--tRNA ligase [archaeon]